MASLAVRLGCLDAGESEELWRGEIAEVMAGLRLEKGASGAPLAGSSDRRAVVGEAVVRLCSEEGECEWLSSAPAAFASALRGLVTGEERDRLRQVLGGVGWHPGRLESLEWKLALRGRSGEQGGDGEALFLLDLGIRRPDAQELEHQTIQCTTEQMQDLVWKLKEASKAVTSFAESK